MQRKERGSRSAAGSTKKRVTAASKVPTDIDDYISGFPADVQKILQKIRKTMQQAAPSANEAISYQIPTFKLNGKNVIHFAGFTNHVSVYPAPRGVEEFEKELTEYKGGKGTVQFPLDKAIDYSLIARITKFRIEKLSAPARTKS